MKKVLIVIDMQNDFITGSLGSEEAQKIVPNVVEKIKEYRKDGDMIYYTQDTHGENYLQTSEGRKLPILHCIEDTYGWEICDEIKRVWNADDLRIIKNTFGYTDWHRYLREYLTNAYSDGEKLELELCGLVSNICLCSNALILKAIYPEAKITVDAQCCAGTTPEKHKAALDVMESCQIDIINRSEQ